MSRSQCLGNRRFDGVELMIRRHLLDQRPATAILEHDEVPNQRQEPVRFAYIRQHHLQLGETEIGQGLAGNRGPRFEPFPLASERTNTCCEFVRSDEYSVEGEQRRELRFVGLKLLSGPSRRWPSAGFLSSITPSGKSLTSRRPSRM